jgi:hypothetical protein
LDGIGLLERGGAAVEAIQLESSAIPDGGFELIDDGANPVSVHCSISTHRDQAL